MNIHQRPLSSLPRGREKGGGGGGGERDGISPIAPVFRGSGSWGLYLVSCNQRSFVSLRPSRIKLGKCWNRVAEASVGSEQRGWKYVMWILNTSSGVIFPFHPPPEHRPIESHQPLTSSNLDFFRALFANLLLFLFFFYRWQIAEMASLYQRFTGKINTNDSFPNPPEASHLLGQGVEGERAAESLRPRLQHPYSRHCEDEDVRLFSPLLVRSHDRSIFF